MTVDHADTLAIGEGGFIEELVNALGRFFYRGADNVDLVGAALGRLRRDGNVLPGNSASFHRGCSFECNDLVDANFHAQRAGFDLGRRSVKTPQDDRLVESANADPRARLKLIPV